MTWTKMRWSVIAAILPMLSVSATAGTRVEPMTYDLMPVGLEAQQDLRVENTGDRPTPVEIIVEKRDIAPDGSDIRTPADDDFLIFPPQGIVPANGFQTFRVRYVGDPALAKTRLYTITVAQLPIEMSEQESGIQLLFNLGTLAAVSPAGSAPKIVVDSVAAALQPGYLRITVRNDGTRYTRLKQGKWTLTAGDGQVETLEGTALSDALPQPLIQPGTARIIQLPVSESFVREGARATFDLDTSR